LRVTLGRLLQVRDTEFEGGLEGRTRQFELERMRFEFGGKHYDFSVGPKSTETEVELEKAWIGADLGGPRLMLDRMKEPFSLEEMLPRKHFDFPTFSILNQFVPAEDHGVTILGGLRDGPGSSPAARTAETRRRSCRRSSRARGPRVLTRGTTSSACSAESARTPPHKSAS
jgi:hypothetical protein